MPSGRRTLTPRHAATVLAALLLGTAVPAQQHPGSPALPTADQNGTAARPTHDPQPTLPPLMAWQHVRTGNETFCRHLRDDLPPPRPEPRPAGAGRYVCAVVVCADYAGVIAPRLGLREADVLVLRIPGPFVTAEAAALIERMVQTERVSLVLLLSHPQCESLADRRAANGQAPTEDHVADQPDVLDRRRIHAERDAARLGLSLHDALLRGQRELLLASSTPLRDAVEHDRLRVVPGVIDDRSSEIQWRHRSRDELPLAPVK